jgi:hypothetical protein
MSTPQNWALFATLAEAVSERGSTYGHVRPGALQSDPLHHRPAAPGPRCGREQVPGASRQNAAGAHPRSPGALATARWRRRKAKGSLIVPVELFNDEVQALVRLGFLPPGDASHRRWIGRAVAGLVERVLERAARPGERW